MSRSIKNLVAAILISISGFVLITTVWPSYELSENLKQISSERLEVLEDRGDILDRVDELRREKANYYSELQRLTLLLPRDEKLPEIITMIDSIFSRSGIISNSVTINRNKNIENKIQSTRVEIRSFGSYESFYSFINTVQKSIRLFDVSSFNISEDQNSDKDGQLSFVVTGNIYRLFETGDESAKEQ